MPDACVLIVDDEEDIRNLCADALREAGYEADTAASGAEALRKLSASPCDIVLSDISMPQMGGLDLLRAIREDFSQCDVILMTGHATVENAIEALRLGAYDYIKKPFAIEELLSRVGRLAERKEMSVENRILREQLRTGHGPGGMIGSSSPMQELYRLIVKFARRPQPVLITGESGTGKELVARAIHENSTSRRHPFVPVDCGALSSTLMESELFGHVPGAFTGAANRRAGLLASAGNGTVFFDEIGELTLEMQAKLLRTIQEREIRSLGGDRPQRFDARILAATNRNLEAAVKDGKFREDLFFRLNVLVIRTPPLRERRGDIPALAISFIESERGPDNPVTGISQAALDALSRYSWPGNVRELRNHVVRAIAISDGPLVERRDLAPEIRGNVPALPPVEEIGKLEAAERRAIIEALHSSGGHRVQAAKILGIGKTTLYKKLKDYGLRGGI